MRTAAALTCPACGGEGRFARRGMGDRIYGVPGTWDQRRCRGCGSWWLDPRPADEDLGLCYPAGYFTHDEASAPPPPRLTGAKGLVRRLVLGARLGYDHLLPPWPGARAAGRALGRVPVLGARAMFSLEPVVPPWVEGGRLLDVGCGAGWFLAIMRTLGWEVMGTDTDAAAALRVKDAYGIDVWTGPLDALPETVPLFDVVTLSHVVEHVPDPAALLASAARCLAPGGRLLMVTPNAASLGARVLRGDWYGWQPPQHLAVYSPAGLHAVLDRVPGLDAVRLGTSSQMAARMWQEAYRARRYGGHRRGQVPGGVRAAAAVFGVAEALLARVAPLGEEVCASAMASARRPRPGSG